VFTVLGVGMAFVWQPLAATATRNLPLEFAGASSGVYNATRQLGAVLGSAGTAAFMTWRITAEMPPTPATGRRAAGLQLPEFLHAPFSAAMSQSMLPPAFIALFGVAAALFLVGPTASAFAGRSVRTRPEDHDYDFDDDDDVVEYMLIRPSGAPSEAISRPADSRAGDDTEPLNAQERRQLPRERGPTSTAEPIGFAHNGFHVDDEERFRSITNFSPPTVERPSRHGLPDDPPRNRHYLDDPDDAVDYGRHSFRHD
ncbi:MAG: MFS transporter, partial [Mycobacterium sp.]